MKIQKTILSLFILSAVVLGGMKVARADIEDPNRVNAIAQAKANLKVRNLSNGIANLCQEILAQVPGENGGADCEEKRSQCETQILEAFRSDVQERIEACSPSVRPNECFLFNGLEISFCTDNGFSTDECVEQCSDNSTPTSRCLDDIDFSRRRTIAVLKYKAQLNRACQPEAVQPPPADPIVNNPVNEAQDQNPNQGADSPAGAPVVTGQGEERAAGGCSLGGMSGSMGSLSTFLIGLLPFVATWRKRKK